MKLRFGLFVFCLCVVVPAPSPAQVNIAVSPEESVAGISQADWSTAWWQWAGSFVPNTSPIADRTGERCHLKQNGAVWFLAGTYSTGRTIRTCTVPSGKYLFFPLINYVVMPSSAAGITCKSAMDTARQMTDEPKSLILDLDGYRLSDPEKYRQATRQCFDMGALAEPRYRIYPSAANGYYVMLRPLSRGKHELNFGGVLPSMIQAVTYTLIVE